MLNQGCILHLACHGVSYKNGSLILENENGSALNFSKEEIKNVLTEL